MNDFTNSPSIRQRATAAIAAHPPRPGVMALDGICRIGRTPTMTEPTSADFEAALLDGREWREVPR